MTDQRVISAAHALREAEASRKPIAPLTSTLQGFTVEEAYAVQLAQVEAWTATGRIIAGYKVGLTSASIRRQLGVNQPDYGHLLADMFQLDGEDIAPDRFLAPRVEPEIAFVLGKPLAGPGITVADAVAAIDHVIAALEIIDSRIADWRITLADTIADNASSGGVVLGTTPRRLSDLDLRLTGTVLYRNGAIAHTGAGAAVLGSPVNALVWLANTMGRLGVRLEAGTVVLSGALTEAVPGNPGDTVTASFSGLGTVTARFTADARA